MTSDEYKYAALQYCPPMPTASRIAYGLIGLSSESGEALDIYKKFKYQGHPLDDEHLIKELGDVLWYLQLAADALGYSLEDVMKINIREAGDI